MTSSRTWLVLYVITLVTFASCNPHPFSGGITSRLRGNGSHVPLPQLYRDLALEDIPTTISEDVILTLEPRTRYGYRFGRPVSWLLTSPVTRTFLRLFNGSIAKFPLILHWGLLISDEPPYNGTRRLPRPGKSVPRPETGIIFELRNSVNTGLIYLDVMRWDNYEYREDKIKFLGKLNQTDEELIKIGRAYIQHVGREGFHGFYRNCQIFTSWYAKALWPKVPLSIRADQLFGKIIWWFKDWNRTIKWGLNKVRGRLGLRVKKEVKLDSSAEFIEVEELLNGGSKSEMKNSDKVEAV